MKGIKPRGFWAVWGIPVALAVLTLSGLLVALLGPVSRRWISWMFLLVPVALSIALECGASVTN